MTGSIFHGKYVLIAGSADASVSTQKLALAHNYVKELTRRLLAAGGGVVIFAGGEPLHEESNLPFIFDWTVLREVEAFLAEQTLLLKVYRLITFEKQFFGYF